MSEERCKVLEELKIYLQEKIDNGIHKLFYEEDGYEFKVIDAINSINNLQQENKQLIMNFNKVDFAKYFNISRPYLDKLLKSMNKEEIYNFLTLRRKIKED